MGRPSGSKNKVVRGNVKLIAASLNDKELQMLDGVRDDINSQFYKESYSNIIRHLIKKEFNHTVKGE